MIAQTIRREEMAFEGYLRVYAQSNPKPQMGLVIMVSVIAVVALMLVAALRTGFSFALSAFTSLNEYLFNYLEPSAILALSAVEAIAAVLGIEGFVVASGIKDGLSKTDLQLTMERKRAVYILIGVSCIAGLFQSASLISGTGMFITGIEIVLAFVTGLGIPIALVFASPYLGMMLNSQRAADEAWLNSARASFENSRERKLARRALTKEVAEHQQPAPVVHQAPRPKVSTSEIVAEYRRLNPGVADSAIEMAKWYYDVTQRTPVNGDLAQLAQAIRTHLSRERNS